MTNQELRERLTEIDKSDVEVSDWEADFLENVLYEYKGPLSPKQRAVAERMIEKYL